MQDFMSQLREKAAGVPLPPPEEAWKHVDFAAVYDGGEEGGDIGIPGNLDATVLVECMNCSAMIEVRTGCRGIDDALSQGWTLDGAGDLNCERCSEARAEILGYET